MNELELLKLITKKLDSINIEYMISGSMALNFYTEPRMTRDIDIVINIINSDIENLLNTFKNDFYIDRAMIEDAIKNNSMFNIIHLESIIKIDFIIRKNDEYRKLEFSKRQMISLDDCKIYTVSIEDLIISKLFWAKDSFSDFQLRDVKNLLKNKVDIQYIKYWCNKLKLNNILKEVLKNE